MSKKIVTSAIIGFLLIGSASANEADEEWVQVADTSASQWLGKKGSASFINLDAKKNNAYGYVYQILNKKEQKYQYGTLFVELESCKKGYGYVYYNDMEGKFTGKDMYVRFGKTVADALGSMACLSWDEKTGKVSLVNADGAWELVAEGKNSGVKFFIKNDTMRKIKHNSKPAVAILYGYNEANKNTTSYGEYVIQTSDCKRGHGVVYEFDFGGKLIEKTDVALNGYSVLAATASAICAKL